MQLCTLFVLTEIHRISRQLCLNRYVGFEFEKTNCPTVKSLHWSCAVLHHCAAQHITSAVIFNWRFLKIVIGVVLRLLVLNYTYWKLKRMSSSKPSDVGQEIPEILTDPSTRKRYQRGRFLGKVRVVVCPNILQGCALLLYTWLGGWSIIMICFCFLFFSNKGWLRQMLWVDRCCY